jgi:putative heme-binding domain-containing protein
MTLCPRPATGSLSVRAITSLALLGGLLFSSRVLSPLRAQEQPPPAVERACGIAQRVPWTTSRLVGSPEAPAAYVARRVFPQLKLTNVVDLCNAPGTDRLFVMELGGMIYSFEPKASEPRLQVFFDLKKHVPEMTSAYGITFHPGFATNRLVYLCYVLKENLPDGSRVSRFKVSPTDPPAIDPASETILITWLSGGHNGGCLKFGPDGFLYVSTGDGAGPNPPDPLKTGQDNTDLLSAILRIGVDRADAGKTYHVPPDNPFVNTPDCRPEIWSYGYRNPWRMSFDPQSGALWVGDVGWELWEMVYRVEKGGNYGWSVVEGPQTIHPTGQRGPTAILPPTVVHPHSEAASITGGLVYHGRRLPGLRGAYVYGDWVTGKMWGLWHDGTKVTRHEEIARTTSQIVCFGEDNDGELYMVEHALGGIYVLDPNPEHGAPSKFPRQLSETGLFASVKDHLPAPGVIPFLINAEMWADGAVAERFVALPGESSIQTGAKDVWIYQSGAAWKFPTNAVLAKTLSLEMKRGRPERARRIETQILHYDGFNWHGYTYRWNDAQTDATLVTAEGTEQSFDVEDAGAPGGRRKLAWRFHSRTECLRCHNPWVNYALAFTGPQLNRSVYYQSNHPICASLPPAFEAKPPTRANDVLLTDNQLRTLSHIGFFDQPLDERARPRLTDPYARQRDDLDPDRPNYDLNERARSWLHVNCAHCHREGAGGSVVTHLDYDSKPVDMKAFGRAPSQGPFGLTGARVIQPGDPYRSVLFYRIATEGGGHMPRLGASRVDEAGVKLIHDWIKQLPAELAEEKSEDQQAARLRTESEALLGEFRLGSALSRSRVSEIVDRLLATTSGALALLHYVTQGGPAGIRAEVVAKAAAHENIAVRELFERFLPDEQRPKKLGAAFDVAELLLLKGDAGHGRKVFFQEGGAQCHTCHRINGEGRDFGPDLSHIGAKYDRAQLLDHILNPSKLIEPAFVSYTVETKDEQSYSGLLVKQHDDEVVLKDANANEIRLPTSAVKLLQPQQLSAMPEGLLQALTAPAVADLLDYLGSLK